MNRLPQGLVWAAALAAALPAFLLPFHNPDLFWHLSSGRWIVQHGALPYAEFLSFSLPGKPWLDFEWLSQLAFYGADAAGGFLGVWLLKAALLAGCAFFFDRTLRENDLSSRARAVALAVWGVAALSWSDARPELFSLLLFSAVLWRLEAVRLGRVDPDFRSLVLTVGVFALWSNLHAGFPLGVEAIAIYGVGELIEGRPRRGVALAILAAVGAAAALLNPYGLGPYRVLAEHYAAQQDLARYIAEWHPMSAANPLHWPFLALVVTGALAAAARMAEPYEGQAQWTRRAPWGLFLLCGHLGANGLLHARFAPYFLVAAPAAVAIVAQEARGWLRGVLVAGIAAAIIFLLWLGPRLYRSGVFNDKDVPRRAAEFMARQEPALSPLRLFNQWEWGGYLAWRLRPWYRVYSDGRYVFHEQLPRVARAAESPESWQAFMQGERLNGALVPNRDAFLPSARRYPDGSTKSFDRPWYLFYFPRERWALVYWDAQALLFVERASVPPSWLKEHEYRWLRPKDDAAFQDAMARGEIPLKDWQAEKARHDEELGRDADAVR